MRQNFEVLAKGPANYVPLSPISFLTRTAGVFPDRTAIIYGDRSYGCADRRYGFCGSGPGSFQDHGQRDPCD